MALTLSPQVFVILAQLIEERTGLHYDTTSIDLLADKLSDRAAELGLDSLLDYYYFLRYDAAGDVELRVLAETLVIHETYLFREVDPLRVLAGMIVPRFARARRPVRIWSAACATGEEPYTLAMLLSAADLLDSVEIVASDLSGRALARARTGVYSGRSLRSVPAGMDLGQFLEEVPAGMRVRDRLRERITWRQVNLVETDSVGALGTFDLVLCRNVLIYFAEDTVSRVAENISHVMQPEGLLLLGASESLLRFGTLFACEELGGAFFYRKQRA